MAPLFIAIVLVLLGIVSVAFLIAGAATACAIALVSSLMWVRSAGVLARQLGGTVVTAERRPNILSATEAARLVDVAEGLFAVFGLPGAEIRVLDDPAANAISVGRSPDRGVVFITSGLVLLLDRIELEAVLAHKAWRHRLGCHRRACFRPAQTLCPDLCQNCRQGCRQRP